MKIEQPDTASTPSERMIQKDKLDIVRKMIDELPEKDPKIIKNFTKKQKKIRNDWIIRRNKKLMKNPKAYNEYWNNFQKWAKAAFSK